MKALVVISGSINYYYNLAGRRLAEALRSLHWQVELQTLHSAPEQAYDWCFLMNITDLVASFRSPHQAKQRLAQLRARSQRLVQVLLEPVTTSWFRYAVNLGHEAGVDTLLDGGLRTQSDLLPDDVRHIYRFLFNGLTLSEQRNIAALRPDWEQRVIPWAVVGHVTTARCNLVSRLIKEVDPGGFVYLPRLEPVAETGPHLNGEQFHRVLARSRYHVWISQHNDFYLEGERFRMALLAGAVPIKIMPATLVPPPDTLFSYLLLDEPDFPARLQSLDFERIRQRFTDEFCQLPSLPEALAECLGLSACANGRHPRGAY